MGWKDVDLRSVNPNFELIAPGRYNFRLISAKPNGNDPERVDVRAVIESDGEYQGRMTFFSYSNPDVWSLSPKAFKRLEQAVGIDLVNGEAPVEFLNRAAAEGARFSGELQIREYENKQTGELVKQNDLKLFSVGPAT